MAINVRKSENADMPVEENLLKEEVTEGPKLFANKAANRALIVAGVIIAVMIIAMVVVVNIQL